MMQFPSVTASYCAIQSMCGKFLPCHTQFREEELRLASMPAEPSGIRHLPKLVAGERRNWELVWCRPWIAGFRSTGGIELSNVSESFA